MKVTRKMLLIIIAAMGVFIIGYGLFRYLTGIGLSEAHEKTMMDVIIFGALGLFVYNRKLANDEKKARQTAEEAARRAAEEPVETVSTEDEDLPHWERGKK